MWSLEITRPPQLLLCGRNMWTLYHQTVATVSRTLLWGNSTWRNSYLCQKTGYNCTNWVTGKVEQESDSSEFDIVNCLQDAQIMGVPQLHSYNAYLQYKARVEPLMPPLGRCSKADCSMIQWFDICTSQVSAKLLLMYSTDVHVRGSINPCTFLAALSQNLLMCWTGNLLLLICLPLHCSSQSPTIASTLPLHSLGSECAKTQYMVVLTTW